MKETYLKELSVARYSESNKPLVSIATIAYNVESFLPRLFESVLGQKTNFKVELIIGEDCSTDGTRELVLKYQKQYPYLIKVLLHKENLGLTPNFIATQNACKGKYIALLDGDDYWTDPLKLQKQIEFLENNPEFSGASHQSLVIYDDDSHPNTLFGSTDNEIYDIRDLVNHRAFHTSSFIYRRNIWVKSGGIPSNISSNERALFPLVGCYGKIKYFKDTMCVYRLSGYGLTSRIDYKELKRDLNMKPWLNRLVKINKDFPKYKFISFIHYCIFTYGSKSLPLVPGIYHYISFVFYSFSYFPKNMGDIKWGTIFLIRKWKDKNFNIH